MFPFEPEIYEKNRIPVSYVGHPLADVLPQEVDRAAARLRLELPDDQAIFALLPGELLTLDQHALGLLLTLLPICLVGGASFTLATRLPGVTVTHAYLAEAAGWLAGGVTSTWLVVTWPLSWAWVRLWLRPY